MLPNNSALELHKRRSEYIVKVAMECALSVSPTAPNVHLYGWEVDGENISIKWDEDLQQVRMELQSRRKPPVYRCGCKVGKVLCDATGRGCKNCCKACRPCNSQCHCKGLCANPHNNGGFCPKCNPAHDVTDLGPIDEEIQTLSEEEFDAVDFDAVPEMLDHEDYFVGENYLELPVKVTDVEHESDTHNTPDWDSDMDESDF